MKAFFSKLINRIPEFSQKNYALASKICAGLLVAVGIFFIYEMFTVGDFGIAVNWNFFTSAWFWPLFVIGLVLAIVFWGKFGHWGGQPYDVYEDSNGNKVAKRNDDVVENMFWHFAFPILGHFILEPIIYGCLIYYPLMCVFALLGLILPYALAVILLAIPVLFFLSEKYTQNLRFRSAILIVVTLLLNVGLGWAAMSMEMSKSPSQGMFFIPCN